jgi:hypothetical protein
MHFHIVKMYKDKEVKNVKDNFFCQWSVLDSNLFSIVSRVCNLTDFAKSHVSSVRMAFTYRTPPRLIKAKKSPCYVLEISNKKIRLIRSLKKFIFRYQYLVEIYSVSTEKIISDAFSYSEVVPLIINFSTELTTVVKFEV